MWYNSIIKREEERNNTMEKTYVIQIFDGKETFVYTTKDNNIFTAENKIVNYHKAFGHSVIHVSTKEIRK
jgi:hypothetical protein